MYHSMCMHCDWLLLSHQSYTICPYTVITHRANQYQMLVIAMPTQYTMSIVVCVWSCNCLSFDKMEDIIG